jgi:outer membrane protein assembly factor BamB
MEPPGVLRRQIKRTQVVLSPTAAGAANGIGDITVISPWKHFPRWIRWVSLLMLLGTALASCANGGPRPCPAATAALIPGAALTVAGGVVYGNRGKVFALRASDSKVLWQTAEARVYKPSAPVVDGQTVIVSTGVGEIAAWQAADGKALWHSRPLLGLSAPSPATPDPLPAVANTVVYAAVGYGTIAAWSERDGQSLWVSHFAPATEQTYPYNAAPLPLPVAAGNTIYASAGRSVYALRASDGSLLWQLPAAPLGISYATPVLAENTVYVVDSNGTVIALDAATGFLRWRVAEVAGAVARPPLSVVVQDQMVYASSGGDTVRALSAPTGTLLWRFVTGEAVPAFVGRLSPPVVVGSQVYVSSITGLYVVDAATGRLLWHAALDPTIAVGSTPMDDAPIPAIDQGAVFVVTEHGAEGWRVSDGGELWSTRTANQGDQSAFAAGTVYLTQFGLTAPCGGSPALPRVLALRGTDGKQLWQAAI